MKIIICETTGKNYIKDLGDLKPEDVREVNHILHEAVGGLFEIVRPRGLQRPYVMICNESGLLEQLPLNIIGSSLYGTPEHGAPIVGNIVIMKEENEYLTGMTDDDAKKMKCTFDIILAITGKKGKKRGNR